MNERLEPAHIGSSTTLGKCTEPMPQKVLEYFNANTKELLILRERFEQILTILAGHGQDKDPKDREDTPEPLGIFAVYLRHQRQQQELIGNLMSLATDIENTLGK